MEKMQKLDQNPETHWKKVQLHILSQKAKYEETSPQVIYEQKLLTE